MNMKLLYLLFLTPALCCAAENPLPPKAEEPLNATEQIFVGKWKGSRLSFKWEIERKADRTFEIVLTEPDPFLPGGLFVVYARGVWWVKGNEYFYEWQKWSEEEEDLGGVVMEKVGRVEADRVLTLSEDEKDPNNIEVRVEKFSMPGWKLKPADKK